MLPTPQIRRCVSASAHLKTFEHSDADVPVNASSVASREDGGNARHSYGTVLPAARNHLETKSYIKTWLTAVTKSVDPEFLGAQEVLSRVLRLLLPMSLLNNSGRLATSGPHVCTLALLLAL